MKNMKKLITGFLLATLLMTMFAFPALAASDRVVDEADVLTENEESLLENALANISETYHMDVCVVAVSDLAGNSVRNAADVYYDRNGYGVGSNYSGIMLFVAVNDHDYYITTRGDAIRQFTDARLDSLENAFVGDLGSGNYFDAFSSYATTCEKQLKNNNTFPFVKYLFISLLIGLVVAIVRVLGLLGSLKSVAPVDSATNYVVKNSLKVTSSRETFLYRKVKSTPKNNPSTTSTTHTASTGATHGGSGGKF